MRSRLENIKYWFLYRFHPKYRYHILNLKEYTGYGWCDVDSRMVCACFKLFEQFVEKENGLQVLRWQFEDNTGKPIDWHFDDKEQEAEYLAGRKEQYLNMARIYYWWKGIRRRVEEKEEYYFDIFENEHEEITSNLKYLIENRGVMWT